MFEGKVVQTGACGKTATFKPKDAKLNDNQSINNTSPQCTTNKKFYVAKPSPKVNAHNDINLDNVRNNTKNKMDLYKNLFRFAEAPTEENAEYPVYNNAQLGRGWSYNPTPMNAYVVNNVNTTLHDRNAYPNAGVLKAKKIIKDSEEDKALQEQASEPNKNSNYSLVEMTVPEWFCPVICAGLDLSELMPKKPENNKHKIIKASKKFRFKQNNDVIATFDNFEENEAVNNLGDPKINSIEEDVYG